MGGVQTAFTTVPRVLQHAELPAVVVFPMRADYDLETFGERIVQEIRLYEAVLFVKEVTEDAEGEAEAACEEYIPLVRDYFLARTGLETTISESGIVGDMELLGDGAPVAREFPRGSQRMYAAVPFYFRVKELSQINYVG